MSGYVCAPETTAGGTVVCADCGAVDVTGAGQADTDAVAVKETDCQGDMVLGFGSGESISDTTSLEGTRCVMDGDGGGDGLS